MDIYDTHYNLKNIFNPFDFIGLFLYPSPPKKKIFGFLMFLEVIERDQWHEMV